ncbi:MAG: TlpA family protein disulfide reductase [Acidobacteria bacterium]|nr:TlpA family protein disulfide reductase [Acidobacteriota bacterium]
MHPSQSVSLEEFRGHPLVVNFWASWCPPCRKEMPALARVAQQLAGKVNFVGLDTQDQRSAGLAFARSTNVHYPLAFDTAQVWSDYGVYGLPTTFFIAPDGHILGKQVGGLTESRLFAIIHEVFNVRSTSK